MVIFPDFREKQRIKYNIKFDHIVGRPLYLDAQATTPLVNCKYLLMFSIFITVLHLQDPRVLDAMLPYLTHYYGNPHSRTHAYGWETEQAMEKAREQVASLIGADPKEIVFTSGATESNNVAIKGVARYFLNKSCFLFIFCRDYRILSKNV